MRPDSERFERGRLAEGGPVPTWDGITRADTLLADYADYLALRHQLADAARNYRWPAVFELLAQNPELVNSTRLGGQSLFAPLHQAAHGGAPPDVAGRLIGLGAWRTLQNARGERPVDVAVSRDHKHLLAVLEPVHRRHVPFGVLLKVQAHFHEVIRARAGRLVEEHALRLPELEPLLELERPQMWFPVPGMHGGFLCRLDAGGVQARLIVESWCRLTGGSGQRHEVTSAGSQLVEEGFV
jgi:hypothetical protein